MSTAYPEMIAILTEVRSSVEASKEADWAALTRPEVIAILDRELASLQRDQRFTDLVELESLFVPTGELQEISMAGGWGSRYLELSNRFDGTLVRCREEG
jgi:hypothetical protein